MFAPVIHTYEAISSVRNVLCVYLWLQNPPDRGRLIFMGSVNRDFVFRELQAGKQTHNSHMDAHTDIHYKEERGKRTYMAGYILYSRKAHMQRLRALTNTHLNAQTDPMPYGRQKYRRIPHVYIARDFLIICNVSPSLLLSTP